MSVFIKYITIILCAGYNITRIMNVRKRPSLAACTFFVLYSIAECSVICIMRFYLPAISLFAMVIIAMPIHMMLLGEGNVSAMVATILSYGITYAEYVLAVLAGGVFDSILLSGGDMDEVILCVNISVFQMIFSWLFFKIRRFSHGFSFLTNLQYGDVVVHITIAILMILSFVGMDPHNDYLFTISLCLIVLCGMVLWFGYRSRISQRYREQIIEQKIKELEETVERLKLDNDRLSEIIHRDNKLIPALDLAVKNFLLMADCDNSQERRIMHAQKIMKQISEITKERAGIISNYEQSYSPEDITGIPAIDALFALMRHRALTKEISIHFSIICDMHFMISSVISEHDLSTILADLIENAVISANDSEGMKQVMVEMSDVDQNYKIAIRDTGPAFSEEVLQKFGRERITTHADTGGSGIGLITIMNICKKYNASILIEEPDHVSYTKMITICFDNLGRIKLQ